VCKRNAPEVPELEVPDENDKYPDVPLVPASRVFTVILPLDVADPYPAETENNPPVSVSSVRPADILISPPVYLLPEPILNNRSPPFPSVADPEANLSNPDVPDEVVPVVKLNQPLTPDVPAFTVRSTMPPLVV
jgi:hypothetical protein